MEPQLQRVVVRWTKQSGAGKVGRAAVTRIRPLKSLRVLLGRICIRTLAVVVHEQHAGCGAGAAAGLHDDRRREAGDKLEPRCGCMHDNAVCDILLCLS